ncbi:MAG: hypothetical protein CVU56_02745 [Deltaproteobacteria bacterium HGW-Deltaproteobacteria-14]|jgi:4-amino-4-deoxy-L-arabinose transferase-like glycosyltransferase|nr:MAG: hypothetical protein CVU56_02745 [Deltaproteobacteria bacterium HGW-Deltaproteobacteria-14]
MARITALIERWGVAAVMGLGLILLFVGLGSTGLWEPWEMDRADLARDIADPPQVLAAIADPSHEAAVRSAAQRAGVVLRLSELDAGAKKSGAAVQSALDDARRRVVAAIVLDVALMLDDPDDPASWRGAAAKVNAALGYVPNGRVILLERPGVTLEELQSRLTVERVRDVWERAAARYGLAPVGTGPDADRQIDQAIQRVASTLPIEPRLVILPGADVDALQGALAAAASTHASIVNFKDHGDTVALPPLESWLRTASYKAFGPTELSTRLPSAILGLLTLWILMLTVRNLWGPRVAVFAGLVLVTIPLFFGQARSAAGEPSAILALTLVAAGLLLSERDTSRRVVWTYLGLGFLLGFLSKGLYGPVLFTAFAAAGPLIQGATRPARWLPAIAFGAATGLLALWVLNAPADGFAGQFRFTLPLFSDGPTVHARNFDFAIREIGFGLFPWSPVVVIAVGAALFHAVKKRDNAVLTVALWFIIPTVLMMATLKSYNQLIWPAVPAAAVAVALLLEQLTARGAKSFFVAMALFIMAVLIVRETREAPDGLVAYLTVDPPFAKKGELRWPELLKLGTVVKLVAVLGLMLMVAYIGRLITFARSALLFFRRERPFAIALGAILFIAPLCWLGVIGEAHRVAAGQANLAAMGEGQLAFIKTMASPREPAFILGILTAALLVVAVFAKWVFPRAGRFVSDLTGSFTGTRRGHRLLYGLAALTYLVLAAILALSVVFPSDYWGDVLLGPASLAGYLAAALLGAMVWRGSGGDRVQVALVVVGVIALLFATRLIRDAGWRDGWVMALVTVGWLFALPAALSQLLVRPERFALGAGILIALSFLAIDVPLLDRYSWVEQVLFPGQGSTVLTRLVVPSGDMFASIPVYLGDLAILGIIGLLVNRRFHDDLAPYARKALKIEQGPVAVFGMAVAAVFVASGVIFGLHANLAENVSQKHVIDAWRAAVGDDADLPLRLFKHGSFSAQGRRDSNFYTADLPEIRDRQTALEVLLGAHDQVAVIDSEGGSEPAVLPGWSPANDTDRDDRRDRQVIRGFATAATEDTLTDASQRWSPNALVGRKLVDVDGRTWDITANDATTVTATGRGRLTFATSPPARRFYAIDAAQVADHRATADAPERRGMLLPADQLSELNYAYRRISGGQPIAVLDGTSYRVLLATSWLAEGEKQQNRLANATYTQAQFDALTDKRVERVWGIFDDEIQVVGYKLDEPVASPGEKFTVTVYFKALKPIRKSYKIFMHMDLSGGGSERIHGDHWPLNLVTETEDDKNCTGCFRTDHWLPGDIVADTYELDVGTVSTGEYTIWLGFYLPGPDSRLQVKSWDKVRARHDGQNRLGIGTFQVR